MDKAVTCEHLNKLAEDLGKELWQYKENLSCVDCGCPGPNLWICLQPDCQHVGCSEVKNDHSTIHQKNYPSHCVHMNISTERIWCYLCEKEVYLKAALAYVNSPPDSTTVDEVTIGTRLGSGLISPDDEPDPDEMDYDDPRPRGLVGLQNMGNTCYMNAALQALSNTQPLTMYFLECAAAVAAVTNDSKPGVSRAYQKLIKEMWSRRTRGYVVPNGILYGIRNVHPMFRGYHQHDTQEFLRCFMDQLHEELKEPVWEPCPEDRLTSEADGDHDSRNVIIRRRAASHGASDAQFFGRMRRKSPSSSSYTDPYFRVPESGSRHRRSASFAGTQQFAYNVHHVTHRINDPEPRNELGSESELSCSSEHEDRYETCSSGNSDTDQHNVKQSYGAGDASPAVRYRSIVSDVFDGKLLSSVQCLICNRVSTRVETFQDLSLPIPSREHLAVIRCQQPAVTHTMASQDSWVWWVVGWLRSWFYGPVVSLQDCLAAFFSADELKGDNMYSCSRCNKLRNGIKMSGVVRLPEVLCVHLKRFRHELMFSAKVAARVTFPIHNLDMKPYTHKDCTSKLTSYELVAVISHAGTAGGGHYTCAANNNRRWYTFDDQTVTPLSQHHVAGLEAYVLFYRKVNPQMDVLRQKAAEILESAELDDDETKYYISKQWINKFNTWAEPGPIDNTDFVCSHGAVRPDRAARLASLAALVPARLWQFLRHRFGGGPAITLGAACSVCARAAAGLRARAQREMMMFSRLHAASQEQEPHTIYAISMHWFRQWQSFVRNKTPQPPPPVDNTNILTKQDIDGKTAYVLKPGSDHAQLSEELWRFFTDIYGGGPEVKIKSQHNTTPIVNDTKDRRNSRTFDREHLRSNSDVNIRDTVNDHMNQSLNHLQNNRQVTTSKTESDDDVHYTFHYKHEPNGNFQDSDEEMDTNPVNTIRMENGVDSDHDSNDNPVKTDKETDLPNMDSISLKGKAKKARRTKRRAVK